MPPDTPTPTALDLNVSIPGQRIIELVLEIVLEAMRGQPKEVREQMWKWHCEDVTRWRKFWGIDK